MERAATPSERATGPQCEAPHVDVAGLVSHQHATDPLRHLVPRLDIRNNLGSNRVEPGFDHDAAEGSEEQVAPGATVKVAGGRGVHEKGPP